MTGNEWSKNKVVKTWVESISSLQCFLVLNPLGAYCGYIEIPQGHKLYLLEYRNLFEDSYSVHGGITWLGDGQRISKELYGKWLIGFDCMHFGDDVAWEIKSYHEAAAGKTLSEVFAELENDPKKYSTNTGMGIMTEFRTADYVIAETEKLARQL